MSVFPRMTVAETWDHLVQAHGRVPLIARTARSRDALEAIEYEHEHTHALRGVADAAGNPL